MKRIVKFSLLGILALALTFCTWKILQVNEKYPAPKETIVPPGEPLELLGHTYTVTGGAIKTCEDLIGYFPELVEMEEKGTVTFVPDSRYLLVSVDYEGDFYMEKVNYAESGAWGNGCDFSALSSVVNRNAQVGSKIYLYALAKTSFPREKWENLKPSDFTMVLSVYPEKNVLQIPDDASALEAQLVKPKDEKVEDAEPEGRFTGFSTVTVPAADPEYVPWDYYEGLELAVEDAEISSELLYGLKSADFTKKFHETRGEETNVYLRIKLRNTSEKNIRKINFNTLGLLPMKKAEEDYVNQSWFLTAFPYGDSVGKISEDWDCRGFEMKSGEELEFVLLFSHQVRFLEEYDLALCLNRNYGSAQTNEKYFRFIRILYEQGEENEQ